MGDHLIVSHPAARLCRGYSRHDAPSILLDGNSMTSETEHGRAVTAQLSRRQHTLAEAIDAGTFALGAAGLPKSIVRQARAACEDYFLSRLQLAPELDLTGPAEIPESLEPMPEPMRRELEKIVDLIVAGDYEELEELSGGTLKADGLHRRLEDECPEALVPLPENVYRIEAITKSDEPDLPGWAYFLELWTEKGVSRLHIEGEIDESGSGFSAALSDILP